MASYQSFTSTRTTPPDVVGLQVALRGVVAADVGVQVLSRTQFVLKKATAWTAPEIAAAQNILDAQPGLTPQLLAQRNVDAYPLEVRALALALVDQLNVIRAALPVPLPPITVANAIAAIRTKAGQLT